MLVGIGYIGLTTGISDVGCIGGWAGVSVARPRLESSLLMRLRALAMTESCQYQRFITCNPIVYLLGLIDLTRSRFWIQKPSLRSACWSSGAA